MEEILVPTSSTAAATTGGTLNLSHLRQILLTCSVILAESQDQIFFVLGDSSSSSPAVVLSPAPWQWLPLLSSFLPPRGVIDDDGCSAAVVLNSTRGLEPAQAEALRAPRGSIRRIVMMVATSDPETLSGRMAKSRQVTRMVFLGANRDGAVSSVQELKYPLSKMLRIAYVVLSPWADKPKDDPVGVDVDMWKAITKDMSLDLNFIDAKSFSGIIEMVANGSADVAISQPNIDVRSRYQVADVSPAVFERTIGFSTGKPLPVDSIHTLSMPFDLPTWTCMCLTAAAVWLALSAVNRWHRSPDHVWAPPPATGFHLLSVSVIPLISESLPLHWFSIRATRQGNLLLFLWLPLATIVSSAYESNLLSSLVSVSYERPLDTFQELLESQVPLYMLGKTVMTPLMKHSARSEVREAFANNVIKRGGFFGDEPDSVSSEWAMEEQTKGKVCIMTTSLQQKIKHSHTTRMASDSLMTSPTGYYYPLGHPMAEQFNRRVSLLTAAGVSRGSFRRHVWNIQEESRGYLRSHGRGREGKKGVVLGIRHALPMVMILGVGLGLSLAVFVKEMSAAS